MAVRLQLPPQYTNMNETATLSAGPHKINVVDAATMVLTLPTLSASTHGTVVHIVNMSANPNMTIIPATGQTIQFEDASTNDNIGPDTGVARGDYVTLSSTSSITTWSVVDMFGAWKTATP